MEKTDIINLNELPEHILDNIPFSIKTKSDTYVLKDLPLPIQYLIEKYYDTKYPTINYEDALDFKLDISRYSDLGIFENTSDLLKEYLHNYLLIRLKSYPFDPTFGCALKDQLMMLDTSLRSTYVSNELYLISNILSQDLNLNITIKNFNIQRLSGTADSQYMCSFDIICNDEVMKLTVTSND